MQYIPSFLIALQYTVYDHDVGVSCFFPSIDGLEAIYESYPYATFVNVVRDTEAWYESIKKWAHSSLFVRMRLCNATGFPDGQSQKQDFLEFYDNHNALIRQFVKARPSLSYIEIELESEEASRILSESTGIQAECWRNCKPDKVDCEPHQDEASDG